MADHILESRVWLARARVEVFAFFADPANLPRISPPALRLRCGRVRRASAAGKRSDFRRCGVLIAADRRGFLPGVRPPHRFVDVQVRGPYARWEHRHNFLEERGGTWVEDRVTYRLPLGPLGRAAHALVVGRQIEAAWAYRDRRLAELVAPVRSAPAG